MTHPLVSVVIPTCNSARFLSEALESVFAQTFTDFEVVVVDDASSDDTPDMLRAYGEKIRPVFRESNSGTADVPRYQGVQEARGTYCAFLDADDMWLPEKLARQVAFVEEHEKVPLVHAYARVVSEDGEAGHIRHEGVIPATGRCARELLRHCFICTSTVLVRREAWLYAQRLEDLTTYGTEWDFFLSIAREHAVGFIPDVLTQYRHTASSVSHRNWKRYPRDVGAKERIWRKRLWEGVVPEAEMKRIIVEACLENSIAHRELGEPGRARHFVGRGLRYAPLSVALYREGLKSLAAGGLPRRDRKG